MEFEFRGNSALKVVDNIKDIIIVPITQENNFILNFILQNSEIFEMSSLIFEISKKNGVHIYTNIYEYTKYTFKTMFIPHEIFEKNSKNAEIQENSKNFTKIQKKCQKLKINLKKPWGN